MKHHPRLFLSFKRVVQTELHRYHVKDLVWRYHRRDWFLFVLIDIRSTTRHQDQRRQSSFNQELCTSWPDLQSNSRLHESAPQKEDSSLSYIFLSPVRLTWMQCLT